MFLLIIAIKAAAPHTFLFRDEGKCFFLISLIDPHKDAALLLRAGPYGRWAALCLGHERGTYASLIGL
jgi:hypothetical protein